MDTFRWTNFACFAHQLMGFDATEKMRLTSAFGSAQSIHADNDSCLGRLELFEFKSGLFVLLSDCEWLMDVNYSVCDGNLVRFNFSLSIEMDMTFAKDEFVKVQTPSWRVINNPADTAVKETITAQTNAVWVTVCCEPEYLEKLANVRLDDMPDFLQDAVSPMRDRSHYDAYDFSSRLSSITADMLRTGISGALKLPFIEGRANELLCYALDHLMHPQSNKASVSISDADRAALEEARRLLMKNWSATPTVHELSKTVGINRNKLFYGFKDLFGMTVSEFIQQQKLEEGRKLLRDSELSILEVANAIGFKHQTNFSTAIRKHFGVTPRQLRGKD